MQPLSLPSKLRKELGLEQKVGLILIGVEPDAPAERAGALVGDILLKLDGSAVEDPADVQTQLGPESVGKPLRAALIRAGALTELEITPVEWPRAER
jgi:S1-C subfamily serine protease